MSAASPVADAYARLAEVLPTLTVECGPPREGWITAAGLVAGGDIDAFLAWDDDQVLREHGRRARPDVIAGFGLYRYAWAASLLVTLPWFLQGRVPWLPVTAVSVRRTEGTAMTAAVTEFGCLPGDPGAAGPGARVLPDEGALRREVRAALAAHLGPVLEGFGPRTRRGPRALWGLLTDAASEGLWHVGRLLGEEGRARHELGLLLPGATGPYAGGAAFRELTGRGGESLPTRDRASCCLAYSLRPTDTCLTCPRTCDTDRIHRMSTS